MQCIQPGWFIFFFHSLFFRHTGSQHPRQPESLHGRVVCDSKTLARWTSDVAVGQTAVGGTSLGFDGEQSDQYTNGSPVPSAPRYSVQTSVECFLGVEGTLEPVRLVL